jgi:hypothetical protein
MLLTPGICVISDDISCSATRRNITVDIALSEGRTARFHDALLVHPTPNKVLVRDRDGRCHWVYGKVKHYFTFPSDRSIVGREMS